MILSTLFTALAAPSCLGTPETGWGCLREAGGHRILNLHGTDAQIGTLYGQLLKPELQEAYLPMMARMHQDLPSSFRTLWQGYRSHFPDLFDPSMTARSDMKLS
jgi:hypothetical protein